MQKVNWEGIQGAGNKWKYSKNTNFWQKRALKRKGKEKKQIG